VALLQKRTIIAETEKDDTSMVALHKMCFVCHANIYNNMRSESSW